MPILVLIVRYTSSNLARVQIRSATLGGCKCVDVSLQRGFYIESAHMVQLD